MKIVNIVNGEMKHMKKSSKHSELIDTIYETISPYFKYIFIEKKPGIGLIQIFDETELIKGKQNRFKIANLDILVLDDEEKPLLIIEPETGSSPKTFGRSILIYTIAKKIKIKSKDKEYSIGSPLLLLIAIPEQPKAGQKAEQLSDLETKLKEVIDLKESSLRDFAICQINDLKPTLKRLFINNGYDKYGCLFD